MVCLPTPARAAIDSIVVAGNPFSLASANAASRMARRESWLRRVSDGAVMPCDPTRDATHRLVHGGIGAARSPNPTRTRSRTRREQRLGVLPSPVVHPALPPLA